MEKILNYVAVCVVIAPALLGCMAIESHPLLPLAGLFASAILNDARRLLLGEISVEEYPNEEI